VRSGDVARIVGLHANATIRAMSLPGIGAGFFGCTPPGRTLRWLPLLFGCTPPGRTLRWLPLRAGELTTSAHTLR
jgi:hypothetical protein